MKMMIVNYVIRRLTEASTLRGIILGAGALVGYNFSNEQTDSLVWILLGLAGFIGTFIPDHLTIPKLPEIVRKPEDAANPTELTPNNPWNVQLPKPDYKKEQQPTETGWNNK